METKIRIGAQFETPLKHDISMDSYMPEMALSGKWFNEARFWTTYPDYNAVAAGLAIFSRI